MLDRFMGKVKKVESGCWEWQGCKDSYGYGFSIFNGQQTRAHRVSFLLFKGEITRGNVILHSCDNTSCVNPNHLSQGTQKENVRDSVKKGRHKSSFQEISQRGINNPQAKLTEDQVRGIKYSIGKTKQSLSSEFKVSRRLVGMILSGERWSHI